LYHFCRSQLKKFVEKKKNKKKNNKKLSELIAFSFCRNWFHIIIEYSWRRILLIFAGGFLVSWCLFGILYYIIIKTTGNEEVRISSFFRYMTDACPMAVVLLCSQLITGVLLQTLLTGLVIAKVLRPKKRRQEIRFSTKAVIGPSENDSSQPTLMIRVADMQNNLYLAESHVRLYMVRMGINKLGQRQIIDMKDMNVGYDDGWDRILLLWPMIIKHEINEDSPLYGFTRETLAEGAFELVMTLEGIVEATGMTFQARTSFLPEEIKWGYRFAPMVLMNEKTHQYEAHYSLFEKVEPADGFVKVDEVEENSDNSLTVQKGCSINDVLA
uniref:IRK_C domain-containing protein n=1 Tax=Enterobius vermicularis TaxID=51028 RepID=A0A0N4VDW6_ENTVE